MGIKNTSKSKKAVKKDTKAGNFWSRHKKLWYWLGGVIGAILLLVLAVYIAFQVSPWPAAMLIRYEFDKGGRQMSQALEKHVPKGIASIQDQQYKQGDKDAYLDVFYPENTTAPLPAVVWVHGGAWVSGNKKSVDNYAQILAARGYVVVSVNYSLAPEHIYPTPILQLNEALEYVQQNAGRFNIDADKITLAGDSAGSQIVAQMAAIITDPPYASEVGVTPTLPANKLKAMLLNCGAYDLALPDYSGEDGQFLHTVLWAYSGKKDFLDDKNIQRASVVDYVTSAFPPSFITAGNADPLEKQSREFAAKLASLGVPTSTLFYPENHSPQLPHEYQFNLDTDDGKHALQQMIDFLGKYAR